jgi:hypothetical protein
VYNNSIKGVEKFRSVRKKYGSGSKGANRLLNMQKQIRNRVLYRLNYQGSGFGSALFIKDGSGAALYLKAGTGSANKGPCRAMYAYNGGLEAQNETL